MIVECRVTAVAFCEFLRRLLQGMTRKIVLIVDSPPTHKTKRVQRVGAALFARPEPRQVGLGACEGETGPWRGPDKDGPESPRPLHLAKPVHLAKPAKAAGSGPQFLPRTLVRLYGRMRRY